jgi:FkbM family methyltransferase
MDFRSLTLASIGRRVKQVWGYMGLAHSPVNWFSFAVLGMARGHPFNSAGPLSFLGRHLFPELVVRPVLLGGLRLALDPSDLTHMVIFDEIIRDTNYHLDLVPFQPDQIFDCGGHIGMFTLLARSRYPAVPLVIFEPNPRNVKWIRRQMELNAINVEVVQAAVSVREGEAVFEDRGTHIGQLVDTGDAAPFAPNAKGRYSTVRLINLPAVLRQRRSERLLLKLDVEGEETRIIPVLLDVLPRKAAIFFETHQGETGWGWARHQFSNHGFAVERRRSIGPCTDGFALRC